MLEVSSSTMESLLSDEFSMRLLDFIVTNGKNGERGATATQ